MQLRHSSRRARAAWRTVDGLVAVEHRAAPIRLGRNRPVTPDGVMNAPYPFVVGMNRIANGAKRVAQFLAEINDIPGCHAVETGPADLWLDHRVIVAAIGDIDDEFAEAGNIHFHIGRMKSSHGSRDESMKLYNLVIQ
ncbi:hypothetical protein SRABI05_04089 [Agrobacterium fabrum]|nr:hypothetical protein SRABI46_04061 [Agrobacterium fabrum]CAH0291437.1 hypothetical protein SRABI05_04089 [Agrobacterium fabrum]